MFNFAFGYEDLLRKVPGGAEALVQPGKHTNVECDFVNSATMHLNLIKDINISMNLYPTKEFRPELKVTYLGKNVFTFTESNFTE